MHMIKIDFTVFIASFLLVVLSLVLGRWIFYNYKSGEEDIVDSAPVVQCPYCAYLFHDLGDGREKIMTCPRCKSYINGERTSSKKEEKRDPAKEQRC